MYRFDREKVKPFVIAGVGGITTVVDETSSGSKYSEGFLEDGDTFFNFSYGGGIKAPFLWGPVGLRADARGRTLPNFRGEALTWFEATGGITITLGN